MTILSRTVRLTAAAILMMVITAAARDERCNDFAPYWSTHARQLSCRGEGPVVITAPNKEATLTVTDENIDVKVRGKTIDQITVMPLLEVAWSPDSHSFFTTESDGGLVGGWYIRVYVLSDGSVREEDFSDTVRKRFQRQVHRLTAEIPNVAGIKWIDGATLLAVAEVPPHSSCRNMGHFSGYAISIKSGRILREYTEKQVRRRWGTTLGGRLAQ
jgi:hypothetical protein